MAPRGLSAEEKRVKLVEILHESKDFFQLKELEKLGPKLKGIVSQSVKEVVQSLVDDGLVNSDKIGSSNFFWSFPSQQGSLLQTRLLTFQDTRTNLQTQLAELRATIDTEKASRPDSEERTTALNKLSSFKKELSKLELELRAYGACDPVKVEEKKRASVLAKEAAIRWTDNYSMLFSHFMKTTPASAEDVRNYLGVDGEYEDIC